MKANWLIAAWVVLIVISSGKVAYDTTRGLRNNNPGNIRHGEQWQGMKSMQTDSEFVQFVSPEYGIRAMARVLANYARQGIVTLRGIISRWAPPSENPTEQLIENASRRMKYPADAPINFATQLPALISALIVQENGVQPYAPSTIAKGIALSG